MPGEFKVSPSNTGKNQGIMSQYNNIENIKLNTALDISNMKYFSTVNVYTWNKDSKYKSYDGVVYSKDGKTVLAGFLFQIRQHFRIDAAFKQYFSVLRLYYLATIVGEYESP